MAELSAINTTTYRATGVGLVKSDIVIGGESVAEKFVPNINFGYRFESETERYWYNVNAEAVAVDKEQASIDTSKEVAITVGDVTERYRLATEADGDEVLKWTRTWDRHPGVSSWTHRISFAPGVRFEYQGALPKALTDAGHYRPPEVVGSYAVYCDARGVAVGSKGETIVAYRSGKMGMIYPPWFTDADGKRMRGTISIDARSGAYTVSVDPVWFGAARFPVVANDTFGNTTLAATSQQINTAAGGFFEAPANGTITTISVQLDGGAEENNVGYYLGTSGAIGDHVAHGTTARDTYSNEWVDFAVSGAITSGTDYWLVSQTERDEAIVTGYYDSSAGNDMAYDGKPTYDTWADDPAGFSYANGFIRAIYATYTTGGGGGLSIPVAMRHYRAMRGR